MLRPGGAGGGEAPRKGKGSEAPVGAHSRGGARWALAAHGGAGGAKGTVRVHPRAQGAVSNEQTHAPRSLAERQVKRTRRVGKAGLAPGVEMRDLLASLETADPRCGAAQVPN